MTTTPPPSLPLRDAVAKAVDRAAVIYFDARGGRLGNPYAVADAALAAVRAHATSTAALIRACQAYDASCPANYAVSGHDLRAAILAALDSNNGDAL